jgi:hypothetical protein
MGDFFNSKFIKDLQDGKLPSMTIEFDMVNILILYAALFVTSLLVVKISKSM